MHSRVVVREIVRHGLDLFFYLCRIRAFLKDDEALSCVFLSCGKLRVLPISHSLKRRVHRDGVLLRILHARHSADGVGMSLTYALAPEGIVLAVRKDGVGIQSVEGEHSRIPTHGDDADMTAFLCGRVYIRVVLRDLCVSVKTVDHVEHAGKLRRLLRQVSGASAAEDENVDLILPLIRVLDPAYRDSFCEDIYRLRIPAGKYCRK